MLWLTVADRYNEALVALAGTLLPGDLLLNAVGSHILIEHARSSSPISIDGFTLHYGLILLATLVLAAVGIGFVARMGWLLGMGAGVFLIHVIGVALLARGVGWAAAGGSAESSGTLVFSLFVVFWGLTPAAIGAAWCFMYWLPRASVQPRQAAESTSGGGLSGLDGRPPQGGEGDRKPESESPDESQEGQDGEHGPEPLAGQGQSHTYQRSGGAQDDGGPAHPGGVQRATGHT